MGQKGKHGAGHYHRHPIAKGARHFDGTFYHDELIAFFAGEVVTLRSEWLSTAQWDRDTETLTVTFKDGFRASIDANERLAERFANTISKGGFWWDVVIREGRTVR